MLDRAQIIHQNLLKFLNEKQSPDLGIVSDLLPSHLVIDIFESQLCSRLLDLKARKLKTEEKSFYTIGSSGHECMAILGEVTRLTDMAFLHYRDAAFQIQRGKKKLGQTTLYNMLLSFCASSDDPISGGRHKVLGSKELFIPPQTSTIASHLPKAVGAALSINKAHKLALNNTILPHDSVIICTFGDASLNHASSQSALNTAEWISYQQLPLPIVFVCEDNGIGISVKTPENWIETSRKNSPNIKYFSCDGKNLFQTYKITKEAVQYSRGSKKPAFLHIKTVRLMGHAGSDVEQVYRTNKELEEVEKNDPLLHTMHHLVKNDFLTHDEILKLLNLYEQRIDRIATVTTMRPKLLNAESVMRSLVPKKFEREDFLAQEIDFKEKEKLWGLEWKNKDLPQPLAKNINWALTDLMMQYPNTVLFGEDVASKGGVYNVTANLEKRFGKNRVYNSLLDETNILGSAIGLAHNNILPIPEIQFLAYVHNAEDQIRGEAATLSFFSNEQYRNGMVVRIAGLAYQKGFGGHFHNDNSLAIFRDIPSIVVACPSRGDDAAMMLRECFYQAQHFGRVCIFIEPIALYQTRDLLTQGDNLWAKNYPHDNNSKISLGDFYYDEGNKEICIVTYGNGHYMSQQAKKILQEKHSINPSIIDLRWITCYNTEKLLATLSEFKKILIVEECRQKGSLSEELLSLFYEKLKHKPQLKRICSKDSFIPLASASNLVLIQKEDISDAILNWENNL